MLQRPHYATKMVRDSYKLVKFDEFSTLMLKGFSAVSINTNPRPSIGFGLLAPKQIQVTNLSEQVESDLPKKKAKNNRTQYHNVVFNSTMKDSSNFDMKVNDELFRAKYKQMLYTCEEDFPERASLFEFFRKYTVSDNERKEIWRIRIGNSLRITREQYVSLKGRRKAGEVNKATNKLIVDDLNRTLPNYKEVPVGEQMYSAVQELLALWHLYRPDIGYVQGMSFLMVMLYYYYEDFQCFVLFSNLVLTKPLLFACYNFDMDLIMGYKGVFNRKIERKCPKVKATLDAFCINTETFILDWMFTIFTRSFSIQTARVFWDIFLLFGDYYLMRIAYAIFGLLKKELSNSKNMEDGLKFIRSRTGSLKLSELVAYTLREVKDPTEIRAIILSQVLKAKQAAQ